MNKRRLALILVGLAVADLLGSIDSTGVNIALPQISSDFNVDVHVVQWVLNAFTIAMVMLLIIAGKIGDRVGAKKLYIIGLVIFGLSSLGAGFSANLASLIIFRVFQGVGTAIIYTMPMSIITHLWKEREKAFSVTAAFFSLGLLVGPVLGGYLTSITLGSFSGWHLIFLINIPFVIFGLVVSSLLIPEIPTSKRPNIATVPEVMIMLAGIMLLVYGLVNQLLYLLIPSLVALGIFILYERRIINPLVDFSFFRNKTFSAANLTSFTTMIAVMGLSFMNTFFLQETLRWDPWQAGKAMLPIPAAMVLGAILGGSIKNWRVGAVLSSLLTITGLIILSQITTTTPYYAGLFIAYIVAGFGGGLLMTTIFAAILGSAPTEKSGQASGILNTIQQVGTLMGVAIIAGISTQYKLSYYILIAIMVVGLVSAFFVGRNKTNELFAKV